MVFFKSKIKLTIVDSFVGDLVHLSVVNWKEADLNVSQKSKKFIGEVWHYVTRKKSFFSLEDRISIFYLKITKSKCKKEKETYVWKINKMQRVNFHFMNPPIIIYITEMIPLINALGRANIDLVVTIQS